MLSLHYLADELNWQRLAQAEQCRRQQAARRVPRRPAQAVRKALRLRARTTGPQAASRTRHSQPAEPA